MSTSSNDLLEMVLRECEIAKGEPWYPSEYAAATGMSRTALDAALDQLRLSGLVRLTEWVPGKGQGYVLTSAGSEVLDSPRLLGRMRSQGAAAVAPREKAERAARPAGERDWDRGQVVREALLSSARPVVSMTLLALNVLNFVAGLMLLVQMGGSADLYLGMGMDQQIKEIRQLTGAITAGDLAQGQWWRLVTAAFVHHGLVHLGVNMYALFVLGPLVEKMLGHTRYLLLYLLTAVAGSFAGVWLPTIWHEQVGLLAGASTSLCGLVGATLTWVLLNKRYLPPDLAASWLRTTVFNIILLAVISFAVTNVSWAGHLGGGVAGAVLAIPLSYSRFGRDVMQRGLGWTAVVVLTLGMAGFIVYSFSPKTELEHAQVRYLPVILNADAVAVNTFNNPTVKDFRQKIRGGKNVSPALQEKASNLFEEAVAKLKTAEETLENARTYSDPKINSSLQTAREYVQKWIAYYQQLPKTVDEKGNVIPAQVHALVAIDRQLASLQDTFKKSALSPSAE
jgi:membrane associated rhomboid family serine protease